MNNPQSILTLCIVSATVTSLRLLSCLRGDFVIQVVVCTTFWDVGCRFNLEYSVIHVPCVTARVKLPQVDSNFKTIEFFTFGLTETAILSFLTWNWFDTLLIRVYEIDSFIFAIQIINHCRVLPRYLFP